jgi:hypothetical protein
MHFINNIVENIITTNVSYYNLHSYITKKLHYIIYTVYFMFLNKENSNHNHDSLIWSHSSLINIFFPIYIYWVFYKCLFRIKKMILFYFVCNSFMVKFRVKQISKCSIITINESNIILINNNKFDWMVRIIWNLTVYWI